MLAFAGDDICILAFSTAIDDNDNRFVIEKWTDLATEVNKIQPRIKFVAYDLNQIGPHRLLEQTHPQVVLSPGKQRDKKMRTFRGNPILSELGDWLKKHTDNKFKMNTKDLDMRLQMMKKVQEQGGYGASDEGEKPRNIMEEVEAELMRRGEL